MGTITARSNTLRREFVGPVAALLALLAVLAVITWSPFKGPGSSTDGYHTIGDPVTKSGITLELLDVTTPSSEAVFRFLISGPGVDPHEITSFIPNQEKISTTGIQATNDWPLIEFDYAESGQLVMTVTVGPFEPGSTEASISFGEISTSPMPANFGGPMLETHKGPWSFVYEHPQAY